MSDFPLFGISGTAENRNSYIGSSFQVIDVGGR
jgi:hypothetical protein